MHHPIMSYNPSHKENHYETWRGQFKHEQLTYCFEKKQFIVYLYLRRK